MECVKWLEVKGICKKNVEEKMCVKAFEVWKLKDHVFNVTQGYFLCFIPAYFWDAISSRCISMHSFLLFLLYNMAVRTIVPLKLVTGDIKKTAFIAIVRPLDVVASIFMWKNFLINLNNWICTFGTSISCGLHIESIVFAKKIIKHSLYGHELWRRR